MTTLAGKVCVLTGASAGIGEATAKALVRRGAAVVLAARREERLRTLAEEIGRRQGRATWLRCDVTRARDVQSLRAHVKREHGRCDVLINNAGIPGGGNFSQLSMERIREITATNYESILVLTKSFLPMLLESRGHIVNIASLAGRYALPGTPVYTAAKHAVVAFSESLYYELEPEGVMVTTVNPGIVATEGFFPQDSPLWKDPVVRPFIMKPPRVARVIVDVIERRRGPEVSIPRWLATPQLFRILVPPLYRGAVSRLVSARMRRHAGG
ncbi:MAG TPA: SDR family NAD(P)-dependent oxidoreductase [Actinomycetota bacterium]|nr:SDR family NAD(P)-dependent oxidoreductase [Actinomycetota bacterium]